MITKDNALPLGTRIRETLDGDQYRPALGTIVARRWRANGELRAYVIRWDGAKDNVEVDVPHHEIERIGDDDV